MLPMAFTCVVAARLALHRSRPARLALVTCVIAAVYFTLSILLDTAPKICAPHLSFAE